MSPLVSASPSAVSRRSCATANCSPRPARTARSGCPAAFLDGDQVVKGLHGTLTLLLDCGFGDVEALRWLFTEDDTLPGTPIQAIAKQRGKEVNRRAQALAI